MKPTLEALIVGHAPPLRAPSRTCHYEVVNQEVITRLFVNEVIKGASAIGSQPHHAHGALGVDERRCSKAQPRAARHTVPDIRRSLESH